MGHQLVAPVRASALAAGLALPLDGEDVWVGRVLALDAIADGGLCFSRRAIEPPPAARVLVIAPPGSACGAGAVIGSDNPRLAFARALQWLDANVGFRVPEAAAFVDPTATVSPSAVLGKGVRIGARTVIRHHVVIGDGVVIGDDCLVKSCAVIGEEGFGFERDEAGVPVRILHLGGVVIGSRVEIGSSNTVCRGTLAPTVIEDDVKTDDHVHVGHNVTVRRGALITACAELSGGVEVGAYSWIGPNASVIQKVRLGDRSFVGIGATVTKSVADDTVVAGNPARALRVNEAP